MFSETGNQRSLLRAEPWRFSACKPVWPNVRCSIFLSLSLHKGPALLDACRAADLLVSEDIKLVAAAR